MRYICALVCGSNHPVKFWAKAVDAEATCMILTSGTEEVICIRERESQTLWMSETLSVSRTGGSDPTYAKLHSAINMVGLKDAYGRDNAITHLMSIGRLPMSFRRSYDGRVDVADSETTLDGKKALYAVSMGKFLPLQLSVRELFFLL